MRRRPRHRDIDGEPGSGAGDTRQLPSTHELRNKAAAVQEPLAAPERQLINAVDGHDVPDVGAAVAAVTGAASHVLKGDRFARADGRVRDTVRPHIVRLEQQAAREPPLQRSLQRIEVVVAVVPLEPE